VQQSKETKDCTLTCSPSLW